MKAKWIVLLACLTILASVIPVVKAQECCTSFQCNGEANEESCLGGNYYVQCIGADPNCLTDPYATQGYCRYSCVFDQGCGGAVWPSCVGWCSDGQVCQSGSSEPCKCRTPKTCSDVITQPSDPTVTRTSPTTATVTFKLYPNPNVTRMSLKVQVIYGNDSPIVDEQNINPQGNGTTNYYVSGLTAGKYYLVSVRYYAEGAIGILSGCSASASTDYLSSCRLNPNPLNLANPGSTGALSSEVVDDVGRVTFGSSDSQVVSVNKNVDTSYPFSTTVTGNEDGGAQVSNSVQVLQSGSWITMCTDYSNVTVGPLTPTPTPSNTPTPTPTPAPGAWIKLKDVSFYADSSLNNSVPSVPTAYDSDDDASANFIIGEAGLVSASSINLGYGQPSQNNWSVSSYQTSTFYSSSLFLSYVKARKETTAITNLSQIDSDGIYIWSGTDPLTVNDGNKNFFNNYKIILISQGTVNIASMTFSPTGGSTAIIASDIGFDLSVVQADGIFIGQNVTTGATINQGLKIKGNLIAQGSLTNSRNWVDLNRPTIFVVFDSQKYLDLLPYLSTASYEWNQTQ